MVEGSNSHFRVDVLRKCLKYKSSEIITKPLGKKTTINNN